MHISGMDLTFFIHTGDVKSEIYSIDGLMLHHQDAVFLSVIFLVELIIHYSWSILTTN